MTDASGRGRLAQWEQKSLWVVVIAAVVPLFGTADTTKSAGRIVVDLACWVVFVVDFAVHVRLSRRYLATNTGFFDLGVVVVTFPWYVIPGLGSLGFLAALRMVRVARVVAVLARRSSIKKLIDRVGRVFVYAGVLLITCSVVVYAVEHPVKGSGFKTFGDALWWACVTITTVGYGDIVPETMTRRVFAVILMIGGIALLGALAAALAAFFRLQDAASTGAGASTRTDGSDAPITTAGLAVDTVRSAGPDVSGEIRALRDAIAVLNHRVEVLLARHDG